MFAGLLLAGCASAPTPRHLELETAEQTHQWPAPPAVPRYRYVGQLTGEHNFKLPDGEQARSKGIGDFFRWLVGLFVGEKKPEVLQRPQTGLTDGQGRIFVTDGSRAAVYVFDTVAGRFHLLTQATKERDFDTPVGIALGAEGQLLVADAELGLVARLRADGEPLAPFGEGLLERPTGLARDAPRGRVYVADTHAHDIKVFNDAGELVDTLGRRGEAEGEFNYPTHLAFANDRLYVTDRMNARVQVLSHQGDVLLTLGRRGRVVGDTPHPKGVAADSDGNIYVIESLNDHLLIYNDKGQLLLPIGGTGKGIGQFFLPAGVWADSHDRIYVVDMFNGRIVVLEYLGED